MEEILKKAGFRSCGEKGDYVCPKCNLSNWKHLGDGELQCIHCHLIDDSNEWNWRSLRFI